MTIKTSDLTKLTNRRSELRVDPKYIHIMKYMGSKRELLPNIEKTVSSMINRGDTILDIFAGTVSVGTYLKNDYNIYTNDVQKYSEVISNALIVSNLHELDKLSKNNVLENLEKEFQKNKEYLCHMLKQTLKESNRFVHINKNAWNDSFLFEYKKFVSNFPAPSNQFFSSSEELKNLTKLYLEKTKNKHDTFPYMQTTFLFAETYFSLEQVIEIDSLRYAIDKVLPNNPFHDIYLSALIYAHSYGSSGTGHFAMFREIKDLSVVEDTFLYRRKSIWKLFIKKVNELINFHSYYPNAQYKAFSMDFTEILNHEIMEKVDLVYADPPYSFVHYSRFYHAVESLIKYDYNIPEFKGRYRTDRHRRHR